MGVCINMGLYHYGLCVLVWVSNPECVSLWVMCMGIQPRVCIIMGMCIGMGIQPRVCIIMGL